MLTRFVVFAHLSVLCVGSVGIGYEYYPELKGWLKVHQEPADWKTARINCHNEGALLASPWSPEFATTIGKLQTTKYPSLPVMFSGAGLRADSPGVPMEPCENKRCRVFQADGTMDKVECHQPLPYACFEPKVMCQNGYEYYAGNGECYKFHVEGSSVTGAESICKSEGGWLAYITDPGEQAQLESMSDGLTFIKSDGGGDRHLFKSGYSDYACSGPHPFICEMFGSMVPSDLRD